MGTLLALVLVLRLASCPTGRIFLTMDPLPVNYAVSALVTLIVVVEPLGLAPIFLGVTHGLPSATNGASGFAPLWLRP
jgi:hypothetical protein